MPGFRPKGGVFIPPKYKRQAAMKRLVQSCAAKSIQSAVRRRSKRKVTQKSVVTTAKTVAKREIGRQSETLMNFGRLLYQTAATAPTTFEGARYWLGNIGGIIDMNAQSLVPMKTINAVAVNQNIAGGLTAYNQTYHGKSIYGKYMRSKVNIVFPSLRTLPTGGQDWQTMPQNYEYRVVIFKSKPQPAINNALAGYTNAPFSLNGFKNEVGSTFGVTSTDADSLPDPTGTPYPWMNRDLMVHPVNKANFTVLYEKKGRLSPGSSANATQNPLCATNGAAQYPSETSFTFTHKINKKLNLQLEATTTQLGAPPAASRVTNYDTSIGMFIVFSPLGEGLPSSQSAATIWNEAINPYIHVQNTFTFTDM